MIQRIMRHFTQTEAFRDCWFRAVREVPDPIQGIWGVEDPGLT